MSTFYHKKSNINKKNDTSFILTKHYYLCTTHTNTHKLPKTIILTGERLKQKKYTLAINQCADQVHQCDWDQRLMNPFSYYPGAPAT